MKSGRVAATTVDNCFIGDRDTSAEAMSTYDTLWHDLVAPHQRVRLLISRLLYSASNDRYDRFLRDLKGLPADEQRALNTGNPRALLKTLHLRDIPLLAQALQAVLR
jgi:digeranylgeranylglycerophospholipid reductase